jgi:outer membrane protein OmpA-like peptidoglycan-associated protein
MKKILLASSIAAIISMTTITTHAEEGFPENDDNGAEIKTLKEGTTFGVASIIGGLLGGPIGFMVGGISGTFLAQELKKADDYAIASEQLHNTQQELVGVETEITALKEQLYLAQQQGAYLQNIALTGLKFQILFHTGNDNLNESTIKRIDELANFLQKNPELTIRLHGYADPRGTDEYNNVLSEHRAINVQQALENRGIDSSRIERRAYGADQSTAAKGNLDAYALERRVTIEVINQNDGVAIID